MPVAMCNERKNNMNVSKKLSRKKHRAIFCLILLIPLLFGQVQTAEGCTASASKQAHIEVPALWEDGDKSPPKIATPRIRWEEAMRLADMRELEDTAKRAAEMTTGVFTPTTPVPWENRLIASLPSNAFESCIGTFKAPSLGITQEIWWSFEQYHTDHPSRMCIWAYSGLPGEPEYATMLYDHNYQTGALLAGLPLNAPVTLEMDWGTYHYQLIGSEIANDDLNARNTVDKVIARRVNSASTSFYGEFFSPSHPNGCVGDANHRSEQNNGELWFVTCWPLNSLPGKQRLVMRFQNIDGPLLT